jgi:hypothetical protein
MQAEAMPVYYTRVPMVEKLKSVVFRVKGLGFRVWGLGFRV